MPESRASEDRLRFFQIAPMKSVNTRALLAIVWLSIAIGLVIFLTAGTVDYWQAWVFLAVLVVGSVLVTMYLMRNNPGLLERRMRGGPTAEKRGSQKIIMSLAALGYVALLVIPGLDHRFGWSAAPLPVVLSGDLLVAVGTYFTYLVYKANSFTSATIETVEGQKVISTGPYAHMRHPMYAAGLVYMTGMPLALGSFWGLIALAVMLPVLIWRLVDEERMLSRDLSGYTEYCAKVRWRLVPGIF